MKLIICKDREELKRTLNSVLREEKAPLTSFFPENFLKDAFLQETETFPFLTKEKPIVVHEIDRLTKEQFDVILRFVENPSPWVSLYLTATALSPQSKLVKLVGEKGELIVFKEEKPWDKEKRIADWLIEQALLSDVQLSMQAAQALVKSIDAQSLESEIEKLICFAAETKQISLEDVKAVSTPVHHETLWQLGDALFALNALVALQVGRILIEDEMPLISLLAALRTQFSTGLEILDAARMGDVQTKFPYLKGRLLEKKLHALKSYGQQRLERGILLIFDAEVQAKNSADPMLLIELLIVKLTHDFISSPQCIGAC